MKEGLFYKKYFSLTNILLSLSGLTMIALYIILKFADPLATDEIIIFLIFGTITCLIVCYSLLNNHNAYFYVDNNHIKIKYGINRYLDLDISEIAFTSGVNNPVHKEMNSLTILLKNNKRYTVSGLLNPEELSYYINHRITHISDSSLDIYKEELNSIKTQRKKELIYACIGILIMFTSIFVAVFLTGNKELYEFNNNDWIKMNIFIVIEILTISFTLFFAFKAGHKLITIQYIEYKIRRTVIEQTTPVNGHIHSIYTDDIYSARLSLLTFLQSDDIYYTLENFDQDYTLQLVETSQIYKTIEELPFQFENLINITHLFKKSI